MSCSALEEINVAANKLMLLPEVPAWTCVKVISAYDNRLVRVGSLAHCTNLDELRLYNNNLEALPAPVRGLVPLAPGGAQQSDRRAE